MHSSEKVIVPYSKKQVFDLVMDVPSYKHFLTYCTDSFQVEENHDFIIAKMVFRKGLISISVTSKNTFYGHDKITMQQIDGTFTQLYGEWNFEFLEHNKTQIYFLLQVELPPISTMFGGALFVGQLRTEFVRSFVKRAYQVYG
ncbi:MAG: type II toxin-antitoxin system RatA family toxin [Methylacidiphilales bacterium]|nr:type II toxin-antitoxin system RatA family toxin [Candidatus Methylacidiphilales bacterium]